MQQRVVENRITYLLTAGLLAFVLLLQIPVLAQAQSQQLVVKERALHYKPDGEAFKLVQGNRRFNRSLYSTNTAFRIEAGDLPEFALYLPGMGGNIRFGMANGNASKWMIQADSIETRYSPETMLYEIRDGLLGTGVLHVEIVAMQNTEGMLLRITTENVPDDLKLFCVYGGVSGKKFSRDGDVGADPESVWYLQPGYCSGNNIRYGGSSFTITDHYEEHVVSGCMPGNIAFRTIDISNSNDIANLYRATENVNCPVLLATLPTSQNETYYFQWTLGAQQTPYVKLPQMFAEAKTAINSIAKRVQVKTPDAWINNLGSVLANAGNAIWDDPTYMHGAVAWRMRLPGWRGAYVADPLGWHDRAREHFRAYAKSQVTSPAAGPVVMDTALNLARHQEKIGNSVFSSGYICRNPNGDIRPHHYDMNLVFIDQLLTHFQWTGDTAFVREMWPLIVRHLAWEKRNFDADDDGLYDAYCCIWASDGLQYSGGGVTHSSAYNYRAFSETAQLAKLIGEDGAAYELEAAKILQALKSKLWLKERGWFAEFRDTLGNQLLHPAAALWTVYHAIDSKVPNAFEAWQMTKYVDNHIPHIPFRVAGVKDTFHVLSTTNWHPYVWSINNVALGELLHTSLAFWQAGSHSNAFEIWKSSLMESLYCGAGPGAFHQLLSFDAARGELYRDFADPIGMAARSLVEGLFGIQMNALKKQLIVQPGYPSHWQHAALRIPDLDFQFKSQGLKDSYFLETAAGNEVQVKLLLRARSTQLPIVTVNGTRLYASFLENAIGEPKIELLLPAARQFDVQVEWARQTAELLQPAESMLPGERLELRFSKAAPLELYDPQQVLGNSKLNGKVLTASVAGAMGRHTAFVKLKQDDAVWWFPLDVNVVELVTVLGSELVGDTVTVNLKFRKQDLVNVLVNGNSSYSVVNLNKRTGSALLKLPANALVPGTNSLQFSTSHGGSIQASFINWALQTGGNERTEPIDISDYLNASVTDIFNQQYLSPRLKVPTLQLPVQGFGQWCYPQATAVINDSGFRKNAEMNKNLVRLPQGIHFKTDASRKENIAFVSLWDNYPDRLSVALSGKASHAWLLMAGSTNPMQSRITNGLILVTYTDNTVDSLPLVNPENWWPIEQDYLEDGYQFTRSSPRPPRLHLQTGIVTTSALPKYASIKGMTNMAIEGGAATVVDMPLNPNKTLKQLEWKAVANDVVIGLMGLTLLR